MTKNIGRNSSDLYSRVGDTLPPKYFWDLFKPKWSGGHHLLPTTDSPTISACTTSTNLSNLAFQSNSTINKYISGALREENLRRTIPEIEPLHQIKIDMNINTSKHDLDEELDELQSAPKGIRWRNMVNQIIAAIAVSWVSMVIGYISGYTSPAMSSLTRDLNVTDVQISWISGIMPLAALFGGLMGGSLIEFLGRKWTLLLTNVLFLIGWVINFFAQQYWNLYLSRAIAGCGVGIATLTLPVYLGETVQPEVRGTLGLLPTAFGNIGILLCFSMGIVLEWQGIAGIGAILALPFFLLIWLIPETPRWYVSKNKNEEARRALEWLRDKTDESAINKEFEDLLKNQKLSDEKSDSIKELFSRPNIKSLLIVLGLMFFQQFSGINAVIFYTTKIFEDTGSNIDSNLQTIIVGIVNFVSTFIATLLIDRLGRKILLYISSVAMSITLTSLGTYFFLMNVAKIDVSAYGWVPLASAVIYVLGFSFGFGPIPWLMMGEILPAKIRGPAASIATGFNWTCTSIVATTFPLFNELIGEYSTFWLFAAITTVGLVFTILFVPETKGQSLEDIEKKLAGVKVRRMSSVANLKPLQSSF